MANWTRARRASLLLEKSRANNFHDISRPELSVRRIRLIRRRAKQPVPPPSIASSSSNAYKLAPFIITVGTSGMICGPYATRRNPDSRRATSRAVLLRRGIVYATIYKRCAIPPPNGITIRENANLTSIPRYIFTPFDLFLPSIAIIPHHRPCPTRSSSRKRAAHTSGDLHDRGSNLTRMIAP